MGCSIHRTVTHGDTPRARDSTHRCIASAKVQSNTIQQLQGDYFASSAELASKKQRLVTTSLPKTEHATATRREHCTHTRMAGELATHTQYPHAAVLLKLSNTAAVVVTHKGTSILRNTLDCMAAAAAAGVAVTKTAEVAIAKIATASVFAVTPAAGVACAGGVLVLGGTALFVTMRRRGAATAAEMRHVPPAQTPAGVAPRQAHDEQAAQIAALQRRERELAAAAEASRQEALRLEQTVDDLAAAREAAETHAAAVEMRSRVAIDAARALTRELARQGEVAQRVEDELRAVTERTASDVALARQAEVEARTAADAATREAEALRAQQAAQEARRREQMEREAALSSAELKHLDTIGFDVSHYNIAVVGPSGAGKSTFINSMRGLFAGQPGAATVGTGAQTTTESARFPMPGADHIVFWDEPGGDTLDFPAATYFERRCLHRFDCIIAMYNGRFTAVMSAIISEALKRGVRVLVVYTKMDVEVHNERNNWFEPMSAEVAETALRERVRDNVAAEVQRLRSAADPSEVSTSASAVPLFFIDSILMVQGKWRFDEKALKLEVVRCFAPRLGGAMTAEELWAHVTAIAGEDAAEWQVPREE